MDPLLLLMIGLVAIAVGVAFRSLRPLIAGGAAFVAGLGVIRATFAVILDAPLDAVGWVAIGAFGAVILTVTLVRAARGRTTEP